MKKNRAVWLTMGHAHRPGEYPNVEMWAAKPRPGEGGVMCGRLLASVCSAGFTRATGLQLQPGDTKAVRFTVEELIPHLPAIFLGPPFHRRIAA